MTDPSAILRFADAQKALLARTYDEAWAEGVASYEPDADPEAPAEEESLLPVIAAGGAAGLLGRRQRKYRAPSVPDADRRHAALVPAVKGLDKMAEELHQAVPTSEQMQAATDAALAGRIATENIGNYAQALAVAAWLESNEWRLRAGESVAWAGEQAGYGQAAEEDGQLLDWESEGDSRVCDDCLALSTMPPAPLSDWPTTPGAGDTVCSVGCFPAGVRAEGQIEGALRAFYEGPMVEIETLGGCRLTLTANHPIATAQGFVPAGALRKGDYVLSDRWKAQRPVRCGTVPQAQEQQDPSLIEDIFVACLKRRATRTSARPRGVDLYGDARFLKSDVEVVLTHGALLHDGPGMLTKQARQVGLMASLTARAQRHASPLDLSIGRPRTPSVRSADRIDGAIDIRRDERRKRRIGRRWMLTRGLPRRTTLSGHGGGVLLDGLLLQPLRLGPASNLHARLTKPAGQDYASDAALVAELLHRSAGAVALDEIVDVRHYDFAGHVYDLQSPLGWLMTEGIITANCRCLLDVSSQQLTLDEGIPQRSESQEAVASEIAERRDEALTAELGI